MIGDDRWIRQPVTVLLLYVCLAVCLAALCLLGCFMFAWLSGWLAYLQAVACWHHLKVQRFCAVWRMVRVRRRCVERAVWRVACGPHASAPQRQHDVPFAFCSLLPAE